MFSEEESGFSWQRKYTPARTGPRGVHAELEENRGPHTLPLPRESLRCPGMDDLGPEGEMARFRRIEEVFRNSCESWGFREIGNGGGASPPFHERRHSLPQMLGRVYSFLDWDGWSGERVVLRPDGTIPAARLYWERYRGDIAKFFYVENLFRFASPEERREVWQCGAELIGNSWPAGDKR